MMNANASERNAARKLRRVGKKLLKKSSVHKLLQRLHKLELLLSTLEEEPTELIHEALNFSKRALISRRLLRHTDENVRISVLSCIIWITRTTAPDAPFCKEDMKKMLKVLVESFEKLSQISGHEKVVDILVNVDGVNLCMVMLDLKCYDLAIEMFKHFLRFIRSNHPLKVLHSMASIMTLILRESDDIPPGLLRPLLDSVCYENKALSYASWLLGRKVIHNCAAKLKPYLMNAVESSGRTLNDYAPIVTAVCQNYEICRSDL